MVEIKKVNKIEYPRFTIDSERREGQKKKDQKELQVRFQSPCYRRVFTRSREVQFKWESFQHDLSEAV